jgi:hypothetical protein
MILTKKIFAGSKALPEPQPLTQVNSTSNTIRISWAPTDEYECYSVKRNGLEVYRGPYLEFIDSILDTSTSYSYMVYGHVTKDKPGIANQNVFNFSTSGIHGTTYAETTAYLNAIGVPNDATVYHSGTPQEITGAEVWTGFNEVIHFFKLNNVWNDFHMWHPMFGTTLDMLKKNAKDLTTLDLDFFGSWTINSLGLKGNGSDTYAFFKINNGTSHFRHHQMPSTKDRGLGFAVTNADGSGDLEIEMGNARTVKMRYFLASDVPSYGGNLSGLGDPLVSVSNGSRLGMHSSSVTKTISNLCDNLIIRNGSVINEDTTVSDEITTIATGPCALGCFNEITIRKYHTTKTIGNFFFSNTENKLNNIWLNVGCHLWENYLKRKTW